MTTPTPAQTKAALIEYDRFLICLKLNEDTTKTRLDAMAAALTAAAEVGEQEITPPIIKERCSRCHVVLGDMDKAMAESNRLWRAINCMNEDDFDKRAELVTRQSFDGLMVGPGNRAIIVSTLAEHFSQIDADAKAATIERCAQVAETIGIDDPDGWCITVAATIRKLKDK